MQEHKDSKKKRKHHEQQQGLAEENKIEAYHNPNLKPEQNVRFQSPQRMDPNLRQEEMDPNQMMANQNQN